MVRTGFKTAKVRLKLKPSLDPFGKLRVGGEQCRTVDKLGDALSPSKGGHYQRF